MIQSTRTAFSAVAIILALTTLRAAPADADNQPAHRTLFAAPFENDTENKDHPAACGMGDLIAAMFARQKEISVVERQQLLLISKEQSLSLHGIVGEKYAISAGKLLNADSLLTGHLYLSQGKLYVGVKVIEIATERVEASDQLSCPPENLPDAAQQMAGRLASQLGVPLPPADLTRIDASPVASLHFGKGLADFYAGDINEAIMEFMRTTELDPDFIDAHYFCGVCYDKLGEATDAVIEFHAYLRRDADSPHAQQVKKMLASATTRAADNLAPTARP